MGGVAPESATPTGSVEVVVALVLCADLAIFILFWFEDFSIVCMREIHVQCILNFCIHYNSIGMITISHVHVHTVFTRIVSNLK